MSDDHRLHEAFQASRASERPDAPPFGRVVAGRARRPRRLLPALVALGGVAAVLMIAILARGHANPAQDIELARQVMAWRSRTDFLLPPSVAGLLTSVPRIGEAPAGSPLQALDPGSVLGPPVLSRSPRS